MNITSLLKLVFSGKSFLEAELSHIEGMRRSGEAYQPAEAFRAEAQSRISAKRRRLLVSMLWIGFLIGAGVFVAACVNALCPLAWLGIRIVRAVSIALLAWAVWGKLGDIETFKGQTLLELTSQYLYKASYSAGVFFGSLALFLEGRGGV